ncbi:hypothetical protein GUJ93_ZPchr0011g28851 [Zizania palustris]|uniref:Probable magnesium transporter n=1 Tax=Zizania palustris TaxID=103762 RepID=A0A8J5WJ71_ZIZPA|nr:hypothetical protein GUJ93_ZPchr0011g28851 [Zizania palustris]
MAAPASAAAERGGMSTDNAKGLVLAVSSSAFIGASFIVKKMGLRRAADSGVRAGYGGFSYLMEPLWWIGMISMIVGEIANFAAYAFAPAILVTPLGALSIIIRRNYTSLAAIVVAAALVLIYFVVPQHGQTNIMVYIGVCSLLGSLTVMSVKALGIALKLTFSGMNQLYYPQTWAFALIVATCVSTQINYLNKGLERITLNNSIGGACSLLNYYYCKPVLIMFKDWDRQNPTQIVTELCGFVTILSGTFLLHKTKDMTDSTGPSLSTRRAKHANQNGFAIEVVPLKYRDSIDDDLAIVTSQG